jgi:hypothetical protein
MYNFKVTFFLYLSYRTTPGFGGLFYDSTILLAAEIYDM